MDSQDKRVMRVPLPVRLIRDMDAVILEGIGGYGTRAEFIVDAIQERILELTIREDEDAGAPSPGVSGVVEIVDRQAGTLPPPKSISSTRRNTLLDETRVEAPQRGFVMDSPPPSPVRGPLFGLHNRDYPSIWALARLAIVTRENPAPVEDYYERLLKEAWAFGEVLIDLEKQASNKFTALFPTNPEKRKAAEAAFLTFGVGGYRRENESTIVTEGPLFEWAAASVVDAVDGPYIGVTAAGWDLLGGVDGITVREPHPPAAARYFLHYLAEHAEPDWTAFAEILSCIGRSGSTRQELLRHFSEFLPAWSENEVSTNAAGYVARAREWGLLEPKQIGNTYQLTTLGHEQLAMLTTGGRR